MVERMLERLALQRHPGTHKAAWEQNTRPTTLPLRLIDEDDEDEVEEDDLFDDEDEDDFDDDDFVDDDEDDLFDDDEDLDDDLIDDDEDDDDFDG